MEGGDDEPITQASAGFESLPAEIRCKIWEEVFLDLSIVFAKPWKDGPTPKTSGVNLFQVNHQIYEEAREVFFDLVPCVIDLAKAKVITQSGDTERELDKSTADWSWRRQLSDCAKFKTLLLHTDKSRHNRESTLSDLAPIINALKRVFVNEDSRVNNLRVVDKAAARTVFFDITSAFPVWTFPVWSNRAEENDLNLNLMLEVFAAMENWQTRGEQPVFVWVVASDYTGSLEPLSTSMWVGPGLKFVRDFQAYVKTVHPQKFWE